MYNFQNPMGSGFSTATTLSYNQLIKVNGLESAKAYPTLPNSTVALFDANDDVMYIKTTDASNYPSIRRFRFFEEDEPVKEEFKEKYVTVEEFNKFKEELLNGEQFIRTTDDSTYIEDERIRTNKKSNVVIKNQDSTRHDGYSQSKSKHENG